MSRTRFLTLVFLSTAGVACSIGALPPPVIRDATTGEVDSGAADLVAQVDLGLVGGRGGSDTRPGSGGAGGVDLGLGGAGVVDAPASGGASGSGGWILGGTTGAGDGAAGTRVPGTGGVFGTGGSPSTGGTTTTDGGTTGTAGTASMGGVATGGTPGGGTTGAGGMGTGGTIGGRGGATGTGGSSTGGITGSGGDTGTGGAGTGGIASSGGSMSTGGIPATGGVTSTGGASTSGGVTGAGGATATGGTGTGGTVTADASPDVADGSACVAESDAELCAALGVSCGPASGQDNCGNLRSVSCGSCGTCADPTVVAPEGGSFSGTTSGSGDRSSSCGGASAPEKVFSWTPTVSGPSVVSTCGSSIDTVLDIATGSCGSSTTVACNNDSTEWCGGTYTPVSSLISFNAVAGTTYLITVDGNGTAQGAFSLAVVSAEGSCTVPYEVPAGGGSGSFVMAGNSTDSATCGGAGVDRVHHWKPTVSGTAQVTAVTSYWPATLYVRSGSCKGSQIVCDNQTAQWPTNHVSFSASAGTDYYIWVSHGSYNGPIVCGYTLTVTAPTE